MLRVLLVLAIALGVPLVTAQAILEDPGNDLVADGPAGRTPFAPAMPWLDLLSLALEETDTDLTFVVAYAGDSAPQQGGIYEVVFQFDDTQFRVYATVDSPIGLGGGASTGLMRRPLGSDVWGNYIPGTIEAGPTGFRSTIAKASITNSVGLPVHLGSELSGFYATSLDGNHNTSYVGGVPPIGIVAVVRDLMPDDLTPTGTYTLSKGQVASLAAKLSSPRPLRWSNGEATSLVFDVSLTNFQAEDLRATLKAVDVPDGWEVTILREGLRAKPGEAVMTPVVVAIPFRHEHGSTYSFNLTAHDLDGGTKLDALQLGVHYADKPQPAGHHDTLVLHGADNFAGDDACSTSTPFLSTILEDPDAVPCLIEPNRYGSDVAPQGYSWAMPFDYHWCVPFEAPLLLGLDFDLTRLGRFQGTITSELPFAGTLRGQLVATATAGDDFDSRSPCSATPVKVLGTLDESSIDLAGQSARQAIAAGFDASLEDLPFSPGRDLVLQLSLATGAANVPRSADLPRLLSEATLQVPLLEYSEVPDLPAGSGPRLQLESAARLLRNPGGVGVFNLTLHDGGDAPIGLLGLNSQWAQVQRDGPRLHIVVRVPSDASDGMLADLIVKAEAGSEFALSRVVVEVDTDAQHADDTDWGGQATGRSADGAGLAVLSIAFLAALIRRSGR